MRASDYVAVRGPTLVGRGKDVMSVGGSWLDCVQHVQQRRNKITKIRSTIPSGRLPGCWPAIIQAIAIGSWFLSLPQLAGSCEVHVAILIRDEWALVIYNAHLFDQFVPHLGG